MKYLPLILLLFAQISFGQSKSLMKVIDKIDYQEDTLKAVYDWVTNNIKYDMAKFKDVEKGVNFYQKGNYKNVEKFKADQLEKVIKRKKGVCEDYTLLFDAIMKELGYQSFQVAGITKDPKGKINKKTGHSWIAVKVGGEWKLCDPTWGAGQVKDGKKFIKNYSDKWYDVDPKVMLERHLPYDPVWQLSDNPMTYDEFKKETQIEGEQLDFDYKSILEAHFQKTEKEQMIDELARIESNGGNIPPIKQRKKSLQSKISTNDIPSIIEQCRASADKYNEYVREGKSKKFRGDTWTLSYSKNILQELKSQLEESIVAFDNVKVKSAKAKRTFKKNIAQSKKVLKLVNQELKYLESKL